MTREQLVRRNAIEIRHRPQFSSVQSLSHIQLCATPWTAARQASLSTTNSQSLLKLMSIELVMPSISSSVSAVSEMATHQSSSVAQSCPTLCNPIDCNTPGLPVHHQLPEIAQTHVHRVSDAIQPSHPLLSPSPAFNLSQAWGLF